MYNYSLRNLLIFVGVVAVCFAFLRIMLQRDPVVVAEVLGKSNGRMVYLDNRPIGVPPCQLRESEYRKLFNSDQEFSASDLELMQDKYGALIYPAKKPDGTYPLLWIKAHVNDPATLETPFGRACYMGISVRDGKPSKNQLPAIAVREIDSRFIPDIVVEFRENVITGEDFPATFLAPEKMLEILSDDQEVTLTIFTDRGESERKWFEYKLAAGAWKSVDGRCETTLTIPAISEPGNYWMRGSIHYGKDGFSHKDITEKKNHIKTEYFEVLEP